MRKDARGARDAARDRTSHEKRDRATIMDDCRACYEYPHVFRAKRSASCPLHLRGGPWEPHADKPRIMQMTCCPTDENHAVSHLRFFSLSSASSPASLPLEASPYVKSGCRVLTAGKSRQVYYIPHGVQIDRNGVHRNPPRKYNTIIRRCYLLDSCI